MPKKSNAQKDEMSHFEKKRRKSKKNNKDEEDDSDNNSQSSSSSEEDNIQDHHVDEQVPDNVAEELKEAIEQVGDKRYDLASFFLLFVAHL